MSERITIVIEPSDDHGGFLTVQDAMRQVLDFIEVATSAAKDDARLKFEWRLISATTNSPFTTVAEAVSTDPEWPDVDNDARVAKAAVAAAFASILEAGTVPDWFDEADEGRVRDLLRRNTNGIAKTIIALNDNDAPLVIVERRARAALERIGLRAAEAVLLEPDYSGEELGAVEGNVLEATTHYGKPALRIRDRLSRQKVLCVFEPSVADDIGGEYRWQEVWRGQRVVISGRLKRARNGLVTFVSAEQIRKIAPPELRPGDLVDRNFTGGRGAREYLDEMWEGEVGEN